MTYYHSDGLSSILKMTDATGDVTRAYRYDSFGRIESGSSYDGYSFTGWEWDSQTSLYFYRGRYYDPTLGRFLNEDPIGLLGGINLYTYVGNDPTNYVDPAALTVRQVSISQGMEGISWSSVQRILAQAELRPHLVRGWMHSPDPEFREKVTEITELGPVGWGIRREFEYKRHGTQSVPSRGELRRSAKGARPRPLYGKSRCPLVGFQSSPRRSQE